MKAETANLHTAIRIGRIKLVEQLLSVYENIDAIDTDGRTSIYYAAEAGYGEVVYLLLKNGADRNVADNAGLEPSDLRSIRSCCDLATQARSRT